MNEPHTRAQCRDELSTADQWLCSKQRALDTVTRAIEASRRNIVKLSTDDYVAAKIEQGNLQSAIRNAELRLSLARSAYSCAAKREVQCELARLKADKNFRPCLRDVMRLHDELYATWARNDRIAAAGENFSTELERIDAGINEDRVPNLYILAFERWEANIAKQRAERIAYRDKPAKRCPRRTVLVDGVRTVLETA